MHPAASVANPAAAAAFGADRRTTTTYVFEEADWKEKARLNLLERIFHADTTRFLADAGGVRPVIMSPRYVLLRGRLAHVS